MVDNPPLRLARDHLRCVTNGPEETEALGVGLGRILEPGDLVCLYGELSSGKTCLVRGLVQGMGGEPSQVCSPSFVIVKKYKGRFPLYHIDLYRLDSGDDAEEIGLRDYFSGDGVVLVEWASRMHDLMPEERMDINISHVSEWVRNIVLNAKWPSRRDRVKTLWEALHTENR